jgi:hypothetical protein
MRGGIDSEVALRRLTLIHEREKDLFEPEWFVNNVDERIVSGEIPSGKELVKLLMAGPAYAKLSALLSAHGLGFSLKDNTRFWILNAIKLAKYWKSNPVLLFEGVTTFDVLVERIANGKKYSLRDPNGFLGFQHKMVSMIAYFLGATKIVDLHKIPVPVDFHVLRMLVANEIIKPDWKVKKDESIFSFELLRVARKVTHDYCKEHNIDMVILCDALWLFSRAMCSWHPDNESRTPDKSDKRKEEQKLRRTRRRIEVLTADGRPPTELGDSFADGIRGGGLGRKSKVLHVPPIWNDAQLRAWDRSCGACKLECVCKGALPAAPYYLKGQLHLRRRTRPFIPTLFTLTNVPIKIQKPDWDKETAIRTADEYLGIAPTKTEKKTDDDQIEQAFEMLVEPNKKQRTLVAVPPGFQLA